MRHLTRVLQSPFCSEETQQSGFSEGPLEARSWVAPRHIFLSPSSFLPTCDWFLVKSQVLKGRGGQPNLRVGRQRGPLVTHACMYPTAHVKSLLVSHNPLLTARPQWQSAPPTPGRQHQTPVSVPFKPTYGKNNLQPLQH